MIDFNAGVVVVQPIEKIMVDLNFSCKEALRYAEKYGLLIIPGTEITRDGETVGHFNALFTTDNNLIYDPDPVQAARNAKAQNALVMHKGRSSTNVAITNMTSIPYVIRQEGSNQCELNPFQTLWFSVPNDKATLDIEVLNMFSSKEGHPVVQLTF